MHDPFHAPYWFELLKTSVLFYKEIAILFLGEKKKKEACHFGISIVVSHCVLLRINS